MRNGWGLLALSFLVVSCGRDFALPGGELAVTDLTLEPARLAAGETLTISFGVEGELDAPPRVSLGGQLLTPSEPVGGRYELEFTAQGTEPEAVDVVVEILVSDGSSEDSRFAVFRFDFTPPRIVQTTESDVRLVTDMELALDLVLSEPLSETPAITLVDATATDPVLDCDLTGLLLRCTRTVDGSETEGWITISTRLTDLAGNQTVLTHPVGAAFDAGSVPVLRLGSVTPSPASRGMSVLLPIISNLPLGLEPAVTVAGLPASRDSGPDTEGRWTFSYFVNGTELGAEPATGSAPVRVEVISHAGIPASLDETVALDFEAPDVASLLTAKSTVDAGESVDLILDMDEDTAALTASVQGVPLDCENFVPTRFFCTFTSTGSETPGPVLLTVVAVDFLGNSATRTLAAGFTLDFDCTLDREKTFVVSNHLGERHFLAQPDAFEPGAAVTLSETAAGAPLLTATAAPDGSVARTPIGGFTRTSAFVSAVDPEGHLCPPALTRSRFVADFLDALAPNPDHARMLVVGSRHPDPLSLEPEPLLSSHVPLTAADGSFTELLTPAAAPMAWINRGPPAICPCDASRTPLTWDPRRRQAVFWSRSNNIQEVWGWDGTDWSFLSALPAGASIADTDPPSVERSFGLTHDPVRDELLVFGGAPDLGTASIDLLSLFDGFVWRQDTSWPRPEARMGPALTFDAGRGVALLFGGYNPTAWADDYSNGLWAWDGSRWREQVSNQRPPIRTRTSLTYDPRLDQTVVFGGIGASGTLGDTWGWTGSAWIQHAPALSPPDRAYHPATFHDGLGGVVVHGGEDSAGANLDDLWLFDGQSWRELSTPQPRPALSWHGLTYDPIRGRLVAYGGFDASGDNRDLWELPGEAYFPVLLATFHLPSGLELTATGTIEVLAQGHGTLSDGTVVSELDLSIWDPETRRWALVDRVQSGAPGRVTVSGGRLARFGDGTLQVLLAPSSSSSTAGGARLAVDHLLLEIDDG